MQLNGLELVIEVSKMPSLSGCPSAVNKAGERSAILDGVPLVSLRVALMIGLQFGPANQSVLPQLTVQLHAPELPEAIAKPY